MSPSVKWGMLLILGAAAITGCCLVDDDIQNCGQDCELDYEMQLVTNMTAELQTQLSLAAEVAVVPALHKQLDPVFTDFAHDVNLSFYDVEGDSLRLHHERHVMDASETSYSLYIPVRSYMHLALANLEENTGLRLEGDERCHTAVIREADRDTLESHTIGLFTARHPIEMVEGKDQEFDVQLHMANCAATLVLDTLGGHVRDIRVFGAGFATEFCVADSSYRYRPGTVVRAIQASTEEGQPLCFTTVSFPSRRATESKVVIDIDDPGEKASVDECWQLRVYTRLADGSITESVLSVYQTLDPGHYRIVKAHLRYDGSAATKDPDVGVSITTRWVPGMSVDVPL